MINQLIKKTWEMYFQCRPLNYFLPFPIGVFGTLRDNECNNPLMLYKNPQLHCKAFLPHFVARDITLEYQEGASAPFEIFFYKKSDFQKIILRVDQLEGFSPPENTLNWYQRTLVELRILPNDYDRVFDQGLRLNERNLEIPEQEWDDFPICLAWAYSDVKANIDLDHLFDEPDDANCRSSHSNPIKWWE